MSNVKGLEGTQKLEELLRRAREKVENMTNEEREAMFARQAIGYVIAELSFGVLEDGWDKMDVLKSIDTIRDAVALHVNPDDEVSLQRIQRSDAEGILMLGLQEKIQKLTKEDAKDLLESIDKIREQTLHDK